MESIRYDMSVAEYDRLYRIRALSVTAKSRKGLLRDLPVRRTSHGLYAHISADPANTPNGSNAYLYLLTASKTKYKTSEYCRSVIVVTFNTASGTYAYMDALFLQEVIAQQKSMDRRLDKMPRGTMMVDIDAKVEHDLAVESVAARSYNDGDHERLLLTPHFMQTYAERSGDPVSNNILHQIVCNTILSSDNNEDTVAYSTQRYMSVQFVHRFSNGIGIGNLKGMDYQRYRSLPADDEEGRLDMFQDCIYMLDKYLPLHAVNTAMRKSEYAEIINEDENEN